MEKETETEKEIEGEMEMDSICGFEKIPIRQWLFEIRFDSIRR
jgi:hypothetical protein